jgi:hypothetical protein
MRTRLAFQYPLSRKVRFAAVRGASTTAGGPPPTPEWIDVLRRLDPATVVFPYDNAVWEP